MESIAVVWFGDLVFLFGWVFLNKKKVGILLLPVSAANVNVIQRF